MNHNLKKKNAVVLQGDLSVITIDNLMQLMSHSDLSGELHLTTTSNSAVFLINKGIIVFGHLENNPMKIGKRLIHGGYITSEHLHICLSRHHGESNQPRIGKILVESGYLQQKDLEKVIKEQIKDIFFEVLSWDKGSFYFSVKDVSQVEDIFLEERMDHLIFQGIVKLDELNEGSHI